ncbi:xanthine dehydrogenase large subunit [Agromyces flavus]|uniref:Xanthine dehydrogenase large subunit n=1 Tax=Agromyces flavus TaxID=589382 RepID=A0A1H1VF03_9MICO|nr:xanthine dehydrogenase molybdopterin binding subunit [Agromyces flavus]MCP2365918.1 xanthine dehydrogenase large subunit [Agromyces flavus]GGI43641.1 dehydrogenase [Agromyces flavus]SDS83378.1 xanthine dehydrogenase, molybdenum binding subunit apoprotein [Agromyces flavus]
MSGLADRPDGALVGVALPHESAARHATGTAIYTDDLAAGRADVLTAWPVQSEHAHALVTLDVAPALDVPGVVRVLTASDVPGENDAGAKHDEPLFPSEAMFHGHALAWVLGETAEAARLGAAAVNVAYEPLPSIVTIGEAIEAGSFQGIAPTVQRGDAASALGSAPHVFEGVCEINGQEHFYLETHASLAHVDPEGQVFVESSTQHPSETQEIVAHVLGVPNHRVTVQSLRLGGGFGGKEMQPHGFAAIAALGATLTGRAVRLRLTRTQDLTMTGKRHPFHAAWRAGFDADGRILALEATLTSDGGWCLDLSEPVLGRALCHVDNAYWIPDIVVHGRIAKTHKTSQTAFRGFGGPQGMFVIEDILGRVAPLLGIDPAVLRERNLYRPGQTTPYGQEVRHAERLHDAWARVRTEGRLDERRTEVEAFNSAHPDVKRGLAITPVKFGISFTFTAYNQAGALVHVYRDGSVLVNHGGTELGQGLHTKMLQVAATALGVRMSAVRLAPTRTDKVPNTSATAASSGADLNGAAVKHACDQIRERLVPVAADLLGVAAEDVRFEGGKVSGPDPDGTSLGFDELVEAAYARRVQLFAAGFYRTEGLGWEPGTMQGTPFKYFAYGVAASEVEVDGFTGATRLRRVDIVHDVGDSLSPIIDLGQVEGGFLQGVGWLVLEELRWDETDGPGRGRLLTQSASTYKLPSLGELPDELNVHFLERATEDGAVYGSKAVGEPPLMLAFSVREAIREAVGAFGPRGHSVELGSPATPEAVFWAVEAARGAGDADRDASAERSDRRAETAAGAPDRLADAGLAAARRSPRAEH